MQNKKKWFHISLVILIIIALIFAFRSPIALFTVKNRIKQYEKKYQFNTTINEFRIKGLRKVTVSDLKIYFPDSSIAFEVKNLRVKLAFRELLQLKINPLYIGFESFTIKAPENILFGFLGDTTTISSNNQNQSIEENPLTVKLVSRILKTFIGISTADIEFSNLHINIYDSNSLLSIFSPSITSKKGVFSANFRVEEGGVTNIFKIAGHSNKALNSINLNIAGITNKNVILPLAKRKFGLDASVDSLSFSILANSLQNDSVNLRGNSKAFGIKIHHNKLSTSEVFIDSASLKFNFCMNSDFAIIDSSSMVSLNSFQLPFYLKVENGTLPKIQFSATSGVTSASNLFESIPKGLFYTLEGIKVRGKVNFEMMTEIDFNFPDSLTFDAKLTPIDFSIESFGVQDFSLLNDTFTYVVFQNDTTFKYIPLDNSYKYFKKINEISPHLVNAVVTAEDGGFFGHKGFDPEGFRYALAQNIKLRRMARGGSTITMQLVKNVFLNQNKNLVRKAEEAIIVWLIETQQIVDKYRILEIYLNIIEWGPNINGAAEASRFYFNKDPKELSLSESIFLASIIPKPNLFMQNFDEYGNLRSFMTDYYAFIGSKLYERGQITTEELENLVPQVYLTGRAIDYLSKEGIVTATDIQKDVEKNR